MAATSYTHITKPFLLPEGFDPEGTDIVRCVDDPRMGYLKPRKDVFYEVIYTTTASSTDITYGKATSLDTKLSGLKSAPRIIFVCPHKGYQNGPYGIITSDFVMTKVKRMIQAWNKRKEITPREFRSIHGICEIIHGEKVVSVANDDIRGVMYAERCGRNIIVGYKTVGTSLPEEIYDRITNNYPEFGFAAGIIPQSSQPTVVRGTHGSTGVSDSVSGPRGATGSRSISERPVIFLKGELDGIIYEKRKERKVIIGYTKIGKMVPQDIVTKINRDFAEHNFIYDHSIIQIDNIQGLKVTPYTEIESDDTKSYFSVIESPLKFVILCKTNSEIRVVGYGAYGQILPFEAYRHLYLHYDFGISCPVPVGNKLAPTEIQKYKDDLYIITEGELEGVVYRQMSGCAFVQGMAPDFAPLDRQLAFEITYYKRPNNFLISPEKIKKEYLPVGKTGTDVYTVLDGPLAGLRLRKGKKCFYPRGDQPDPSSEIVTMIQERYPSIIILN